MKKVLRRFPILFIFSCRWEFGPWTDCSKTCNDGTRGVRSREVFCATDSQSVEIEVKESDCKGPKPAAYEECGTQLCPAEWYTVRAGAVSQII